MNRPYIKPTRAEFEAAPIVIRARSQIARLQSVLDYGIGDTARALKIRDILESSVEHCFEHEAGLAIGGLVSVQLAYTLYDWAPAINHTTAELERAQVAA